MMKPPSIFGIFSIFFMLTCSQCANNNGGFIFTSPKRLFSGSDEKVCIAFRNISEPANVSVAILEQKGHKEIASVNEHISIYDQVSGGKCFNISIPRTKSKKGRLILSVSFPAEDYSINYDEQILIQTHPDVVYILTDKPVYSGGHAVKFRIFIVGSDLTPVEEDIERIWIENPNGVHIAQWLNESTSNGFIDKSFQLSGEPLTGLWTIKVKRKFDDITIQGFTVENYVLPRFTVSLDTPKSINSSVDFNITVCAKYMFGEPVHGSVNLHIYIKCSFSFYCPTNDMSSKDRLRLNRDGCVTHGYRLNNITSFAQKVVVNATVKEIGTSIEATATGWIDISVPVRGTGLEFSSSTKQKPFKPGLPFRGQIIQKSSSLPEDSAIMLCSDITGVRKCSQLRLEKGELDFILPPVMIRDEKNFYTFLEMNYVNKFEEGGQYNTKLSLVPWYSPTGSYLQVEDFSSGVLKCNRIAAFNVLFSTTNTADIPIFHFLVKSRGKILTDGILSPTSDELSNYDVNAVNIIGTGDFTHVKQFSFSLNITSNYSPNAHLLVYYIKSDGEIVADTLGLNIAKCLRTQVQTQWATDMSLPGDINKFEIRTRPNSICALSVTDRSTKFLSKSTEFSKESVFKSLRKFEGEAGSPDSTGKRCFNVTTARVGDEIDSFLNFPETDSRFVDSQQAFEDFGALVISNLALQTRPCKHEWRTEKSMRNVTGRQFGMRTYGNELENIIQPRRSDIIKLLAKQKEMSLGFELRNFFPETWLWDIITIGESGAAELNVIAPHTITEWDSEVICLSKETGLGLSEIKRITTYQPFFLDFIVPHSVKRKEVFYLAVSIFNYEDENLPIKITCNPSNKFVLKRETSYSYCVKSKSKVVHKFVLEPTMLGKALITVMAENDHMFEGRCGNITRSMRDTVSKETIIKHEGFPAEDVKSGFICADNKNFENEVSWAIKIPADIVESSVAVDGLVCGDILGPSLKNIDKLLTLPTGCGEQNMILLAPNILILEYLLLTKPDESEIIEKALKNLDLGYQKQLNFRHGDGSYSAFGEKDERGSIWLTSFVVRYLSQAQKFIHIDKQDLNISVQWILRHQLENGCFPVIGKIYHRDLKERFSENESSKALTAYIIISLIESGLVSKSTPLMKNAIFCLKGIEQAGTYGDLLTTYALLMVGEVREAQALMFELLKSANRVYGLLWWETDRDSSAESSVEMTAYGILCLLKLGGSHFTAAASDAVKWITQYRNHNGGFVSSQDTILALEAISKLSASLPRMSRSDKLVINLESMNNNFSFDVTKENIFLQQKLPLPTYLSDVKFTANGKGCALVQTHLRYNVRHGTHNNQLKIQLKIDSVSDIDLYFVTKFGICVRHKSATESIKMAVLEVFMVSGFYPDRTSLYDIPILRKGVRKWEEYEERVVFYFEELKQKKVCVHFLVNQEACVEKTSPALIKLYDYYNTKHSTTVKYSLQPECSNGTGNWLDLTSDQKVESKRDISHDYHSDDGYVAFNGSKSGFDDFVDVTYDLDTPHEVGPLPLYVPGPSNTTLENICPSCLPAAPDVFPGLFCSAQRAITVYLQEDGLLEIVYDITPRTSPKLVERTVSFTVNNDCTCLPLQKVNTTALIIITPLKTVHVNTPQHLQLDNSSIIISLQFRNELPDYVKEAIEYCQRWNYNG